MKKVIAFCLGVCAGLAYPTIGEEYYKYKQINKCINGLSEELKTAGSVSTKEEIKALCELSYEVNSARQAMR